MLHPLFTQLQTALCNWLCNGRHLNDDVRHYADTVLGGSDAGTLREVLAPEHPDHETFVEFLLFPDTALLEAVDDVLQRSIEQTFNTTQTSPVSALTPLFSAADEAMLATALQKAAPLCFLHLNANDRISFSVPEHVWQDTIRRLHLIAVIPQPIRDIIEYLQPKTTARFTRIRLRASRLPLHGVIGSMLMRFLERYPCTDPAYRSALEFWLHFLSSLPASEQKAMAPQMSSENTAADALPKTLQKTLTGTLTDALTDAPATSLPHTRNGQNAPSNTPGDQKTVSTTDDNVWHILQTRQQRLMRGLRQSQEFSEKLQRFSMELMMMQGAHPPFIHEDDARKQIRIMERISLAVFAKSLMQGEALREADFGTVNPEWDMDGVLRTLSLLDK